MILDSQVSFVPIGSPVSMSGTAGLTVASNVIDLLGQGVGTAPANIIGNATVFGMDVGIGGVKPHVDIAVGTAFTTANAATLNVQFQAAIDTGSAGGYAAGTWNTLVETGVIAAASLPAATVFGRFDFPPAFPANLNPRYLRLNFVTTAATTFTTGTIAFAVVTMVRDDQANKYAAGNFTVA